LSDPLVETGGDSCQNPVIGGPSESPSRFDDRRCKIVTPTLL
jgi:hypothetical protein